MKIRGKTLIKLIVSYFKKRRLLPVEVEQIETVIKIICKYEDFIKKS